MITVEGDDKQRLKALQHVDPSLAEVFFGSYPVIVEGDTEHAAFIQQLSKKQHELIDKVIVIRARGRGILVPLIKVMKHLKIEFGIVHDCDPSFTEKGREQRECGRKMTRFGTRLFKHERQESRFDIELTFRASSGS